MALNRRNIPVYATIIAIVFYTIVHVQTLAQLHNSGAVFGKLIFFALPIIIRIYFCYRAVKEEGLMLTIFTIVGLYSAVRTLIRADQVSSLYIAADVCIAVSLVLWFIWRFVEVSINEKEYGMRSIPKVDLKAPISDAYELYGEPIETEKAERNAEATTYTFQVGEYHQAVISEWKGEMHSITYWSTMSMPGPDLDGIKEHFSQGHGWNVMENGYWYQRKDGTVRLWCSVAPAIGVGTIEFLASGSDDEADD